MAFRHLIRSFVAEFHRIPMAWRPKFRSAYTNFQNRPVWDPSIKNRAHIAHEPLVRVVNTFRSDSMQVTPLDITKRHPPSPPTMLVSFSAHPIPPHPTPLGYIYYILQTGCAFKKLTLCRGTAAGWLKAPKRTFRMWRTSEHTFQPVKRPQTDARVDTRCQTCDFLGSHPTWKMTQNWSKNDPKMIQKWSPKSSTIIKKHS